MVQKTEPFGASVEQVLQARRPTDIVKLLKRTQIKNSNQEKLPYDFILD